MCSACSVQQVMVKGVTYDKVMDHQRHFRGRTKHVQADGMTVVQKAHPGYDQWGSLFRGCAIYTKWYPDQQGRGRGKKGERGKGRYMLAGTFGNHEGDNSSRFSKFVHVESHYSHEYTRSLLVRMDNGKCVHPKLTYSVRVLGDFEVRVDELQGDHGRLIVKNKLDWTKGFGPDRQVRSAKHNMKSIFSQQFRTLCKFSDYPGTGWGKKGLVAKMDFLVNSKDQKVLNKFEYWPNAWPCISAYNEPDEEVVIKLSGVVFQFAINYVQSGGQWPA